MTEDTLKLVKAIVQKTIGHELSAIIPDEHKQTENNNNTFQLSEYNTYETLPETYVDKDWKELLTDEDYAVLETHGFTKDRLNNWEGRPIKLYINYIEQLVLVISTSDSSWWKLAGRRWEYNLVTKEFGLTRMS